MGNTFSTEIPNDSNEQWCVVPVARTDCNTRMFIGPHQADPRIVPGLVSQPEWDTKMRLFDTQIGAKYKGMINQLGVGIAVCCIVPQLARLNEDFPIWGYLVVSYIPMMFILGKYIMFLQGLPNEVKKVFNSFEAKGLSTEFFVGNKHQRPRLGEILEER